MHRFHLLVGGLALMLLTTTGVAAEYRVSVDEVQFQLGEHVVALISTVEGSDLDLGMESDLSRSSWQITVEGEAEVSLGRAREPGLYVVRLFDAAAPKARPVVLFLLFEKRPDGSLILKAETAKQFVARMEVQNRVKEHKDVFRSFGKGLTKERLERVCGPVLKEWAKKSWISGSTTIVVCVVPGMTPQCLVRVGTHSVDIVAELLIALADSMVEDGPLTAEQAKIIKACAWLFSTGTDLAATFADGDASKVMKAVGVGMVVVNKTVEAVDVPAGVKLGTKYTSDTFDKMFLLIEMAENLKK